MNTDSQVISEQVSDGGTLPDAGWIGGCSQSRAAALDRRSLGVVGLAAGVRSTVQYCSRRLKSPFLGLLFARNDDFTRRSGCPERNLFASDDGRRTKANPTRSRDGLTLIELLVVLSIIAVLSSVVLRNVAQMTQENRYDANIDQLEEIEASIVGDSAFVGFVSDIGRLPSAQGTDPLTQLSELWEAGGLPAYAIVAPSGDSEVRVGAGWRGPYLNLGLNRSEVTDGFGNSLIPLDISGSAADDGDPISIIQSGGANGTTDLSDSGINEDLAIVFAADSTAVSGGLADTEGDFWRSDLVVTVVRDGGSIALADGANLIVRVYGANGAGGAHTVLEEKRVLPADSPSESFTLSDLPVGALALRAYQDATDPANKDSAITTTLPERRSPVTQIRLGQFNEPVTLTLY
ncbi:MAG: prepilin-type N-terminal cleavage/methylation domain-containing protein [Verrucomicrobiota bacterium]